MAGSVHINKILLPTDGSGAAGRALVYAAFLARNFNARVIVLHAYKPPIDSSFSPHFYRSTEPTKTVEEAKKLTGRAAASLQKAGIDRIELETVAGPPADVIVGSAETHQADLIVIGARGLGQWQGVLMGSVSLAVVQRAECPVLVVK